VFVRDCTSFFLSLGSPTVEDAYNRLEKIIIYMITSHCTFTLSFLYRYVEYCMRNTPTACRHV